jgi:hypothetical protein
MAVEALLSPVAALGQVVPETNNSAKVLDQAQSTPTESSDGVGPAELRNYSLGAAPQTQAPPAPAVASDPLAPLDRATGPLPATSEQLVSKLRATRAPMPPAARVIAPSASESPIAPTTDKALVTVPPLPGEADVPQMASRPQEPAATLRQPAADEGSPILPWKLALAIAAAAAAFALWFRYRWRSEPVALVAAGEDHPHEIERKSSPAATPHLFKPAPQPRLPVEVPFSRPPTIRRPNAAAAPKPASPVPATVGRSIPTRGRPWLEIEYEPTRAVIDDDFASIEFDVFILNDGEAPARNVLVEACLMNAGPEQDAEVSGFFDAPVGAGDRIASIPPMGRIGLKSAVSLPLDQIHAHKVDGRRLFVPLVAFNTLYGWAGNTGQTSASYIVGLATSEKDGDGNSRMGPIELDRGPHIAADLESRRHPVGVSR